MMSRAKLRKTFEQVLQNIWQVWKDEIGRGSPFESTEIIGRTFLPGGEETTNAFWHHVGWAKGVSQAMGWEIVRPERKN